jgi:hypothetical protein
VKSRDILSSVPIAVRPRHGRLASAGLVVDVPQFAASIFQEKLALNPIHRGEEDSEEDSEPGEQHSKCDEHGIRDHDLTSSFMQQFEPLFRLFEAQFSLISSKPLPGPVVE